MHRLVTDVRDSIETCRCLLITACNIVDIPWVGWCRTARPFGEHHFGDAWWEQSVEEQMPEAGLGLSFTARVQGAQSCQETPSTKSSWGVLQRVSWYRLLITRAVLAYDVLVKDGADYEPLWCHDWLRRLRWVCETWLPFFYFAPIGPQWGNWVFAATAQILPLYTLNLCKHALRL